MATTGGMLTAFVVGYLIADRNKTKEIEPKEEEGGYQPPTATDEELEDSWLEVYSLNGETVWKYGKSAGIAYSNGENNLYYEYYIVIGNDNHTSFISSNSFDNININGSSARVFSSEEEAIQYLDSKNAPKEDPTSPEAPPIPEEPEDDGGFSLPTQPNPFDGFRSPTFNINQRF